jgi:hypothetical protein
VLVRDGTQMARLSSTTFLEALWSAMPNTLRWPKDSNGFRRSGVRVLIGPDILPLHSPTPGNVDQYPWHLILPAFKEAAAQGTPV